MDEPFPPKKNGWNRCPKFCPGFPPGSITLTLVFSMDLQPGDVLRVTCQGLGAYEIFGDSLTMSSRGFDLAQGGEQLRGLTGLPRFSPQKDDAEKWGK